ncbi:MAG: hypothetical protein MHM6MM_005435 [Cercozoa sp. M6MM]
MCCLAVSIEDFLNLSERCSDLFAKRIGWRRTLLVIAPLLITICMAMIACGFAAIFLARPTERKLALVGALLTIGGCFFLVSSVVLAQSIHRYLARCCSRVAEEATAAVAGLNEQLLRRQAGLCIAIDRRCMHRTRRNLSLDLLKVARQDPEAFRVSLSMRHLEQYWKYLVDEDHDDKDSRSASLSSIDSHVGLPSQSLQRPVSV